MHSDMEERNAYRISKDRDREDIKREIDCVDMYGMERAHNHV